MRRPPRSDVIARWLLVAPGHHEVRLTLDVGGHLLPELRREIADRMDDMLGRPQPPPGDDRVADEVEDAGDEGPEASSEADDSPTP